MKMTLVCMVIIPEVSFRDSGFPLEGFGIPLRSEFSGFGIPFGGEFSGFGIPFGGIRDSLEK